MDPKSYIATTFQRLTGLTIPRFLELAQGLFIRFSEGHETRIAAKWFGDLRGAYSAQEIDSFLRTLSKSLSDVRLALLARDKDNISKGRPDRAPAEYWEQTPFINYPLISKGSEYIMWDRYVLYRCVEHFIYNLLRADNAKLFMAHFGPVFERYVEKAIVLMGLPFATEAQLKAAFGEESDAIDFIISEGDANIFLDAKGVEMSYQGKSTHESSELARWLDTSALKAIKQAHKVMSKLQVTADNSVLLRRRATNYLITVTYSELYVGSGRTLAEAVGPDKLAPLMATSSGIDPIPLENMYFMTVQEFELLCEAVRSGQATLTQLLNHAIENDKDPRTQKFDFGLHLASAGIDVRVPEYLVSRAVADAQALANKLK